MSCGVAVVGYGRWGPNHARTLQAMASCDLRWVCDAAASARARAQEALPGVRTTAELDTLLADPAVQAVVVATPAASHVELGRACLRAGKHVLVEKPLAPDLAGAQSLVAEAERCGAVLHVGHICAHQAGVQAVRQLIEGGRLGALRVVDAERTSVPAAQPDVNVLWDLAVHDISILNSWVGRAPLRVAAGGCLGAQGSLIVAASATLWYPGEVLGRVRVSWLGPRKRRVATATGDDAVAEFDDLAGARAVTLHDAAGAQVQDLELRQPLEVELKDFLDAIAQGQRSITGAQAGLDVMRCLAGLELSLERDGQSVALESLSSA